MDLFEWADQNLEKEKRKIEEERQTQIEAEERRHVLEEEEKVRRIIAEKDEKRKAKQARLNEMMEKINSRYGTGTVKKGKS